MRWVNSVSFGLVAWGSAAVPMWSRMHAKATDVWVRSSTVAVHLRRTLLVAALTGCGALTACADHGDPSDKQETASIEPHHHGTGMHPMHGSTGAGGDSGSG